MLQEDKPAKSNSINDSKGRLTQAIPKSTFTKAISIGSIPNRDSLKYKSLHSDEKKDHSIDRNTNVMKKKMAENIAPTVSNRSQIKPKSAYKRAPIQLDPYYSHFILVIYDLL